MGVTQRIYLISHRKEPAFIRFCLLGDITARTSCREHLKARSQPMVEPDSSFRAGNLIPQIHTTSEGPVNFKLTEGIIGKANESNSGILCLDWMYHRIGSTHYLDRTNILSYKIADDFNAMAAHIHNGTTSGLFKIPEPV